MRGSELDAPVEPGQQPSDRAGWGRRETAVFAATLGVLALLPWTVRHWPSQDGPNHLAVVHVLMHYGDPGSPFPKYLDIETGFRPSTALYSILTVLGRWMALETAEKLLVSAAVVLLPVSLLALLRRTMPQRAPSALLALPFVVGWGFGMGFLSFELAMGFGVLMLALGWDPANAGDRGWLPGPRHLLAALALCISVWFHPVGGAIAGLGLLLLEGRQLLTPSRWSRLVVVGAPAALFLGIFLAVSPSHPPAAGAETYFARPIEVLGGLLVYHVAYSPLELVPRVVALIVLGRFAYVSGRKHSPLGTTPEGSILRLILAFTILYAVTPHALQGWFYSSTRFLLYASLLLPAAAQFPGHIRARLAQVAPVLTAAVLVAQWPNIRGTSGQMQQILDVGASLPRGARIVPMDFATRLMGPQALGHAWAELVVERDAIASQLFAAGKPRMGGEHFRTLAFHPGLLDEKTGALPWSTYEGWYETERRCGPHPVMSRFDASSKSCASMLSERKETLDAVLDRYDDVLMLDPPEYAKALLADRLELVDHRGSAWMFRVVSPPPSAEP